MHTLCETLQGYKAIQSKLVNPKLKCPLLSQIEMSPLSGDFGCRIGSLNVRGWGHRAQPVGAGQATAPGKRSASGRRLHAAERWVTEAPAYSPAVHTRSGVGSSVIHGGRVQAWSLNRGRLGSVLQIAAALGRERVCAFSAATSACNLRRRSDSLTSTSSTRPLSSLSSATRVALRC